MDDEAWLYKADDESAGAKKDENGVENRSQREIGQALKQSLPEFMLDPSIWVTFWRALLENHSLLSSSAISPYDPLVPRAVRVFLGSSLWPAMFSVARMCPVS